MSRFTLKDLAKKVLEEEKHPLTVEEIWSIAKQRGYNELGNFTGRTPWRSIGAQIYVDIRDNSDSPFTKIVSKPKKFFLKTLVSERKLREIEEKERGKIKETKKVKYSERKVHPFLTYFAYYNENMRAHTKTIYHEKSRKRNWNQWIHPDIVGVYFPIEEWKEEVLDFSKEIGTTTVKLFSFEVKTELDSNNLRESFFQAVSNSSWANEAYLVTTIIEEDEEFLKELKRLSTSFGIGVIKLDIDDPDASEIMFPAKNKGNLDWGAINKLADENPDFREFLKRIRVDLSTKEPRKEKYDPVLEVGELVEIIKK